MKKSPKTKRNSILMSIGLVAATAIYVVSQYLGNPSTSVASAVPSGQSQSISNVSSTQAPPPVLPSQSKSKPAAGLYIDGTYTGSSADAYYGTVQVQAVVQNGKLASVQILQYPSSHSTSVYINNQAMPILQSEAVQSQSANVNIVSGATFTSQAFQQSLTSALSQAQG